MWEFGGVFVGIETANPLKISNTRKHTQMKTSGLYFGGEFVGLRRGICGNTGRKPSAMAGEIALKRKKEKRKKKGPKTNKKCGPKAEQIIFKFMANWWKSSKCILNLIYIRNEKDKNAIKKGTQKPCLS